MLDDNIETFVPRQLGNVSKLESDPDKVKLDLIPNPHPGLLYVNRFSIPEFTSRCPVTNAPDFATLLIDYVPDRYLVESKALKLWTYAFRDHGSFHEAVTVHIGDRLFRELDPIWLRIAGFWNARGGISIDVVWENGDLPKNVRPLSIDVIRPYHSRM